MSATTDMPNWTSLPRPHRAYGRAVARVMEALDAADLALRELCRLNPPEKSSFPRSAYAGMPPDLIEAIHCNEWEEIAEQADGILWAISHAYSAIWSSAPPVCYPRRERRRHAEEYGRYLEEEALNPAQEV